MPDQVIPEPGKNGGARPRAGRKPRVLGEGKKDGRPPKDQNSTSDPYIVLAKAKAKHEMYKAQLAELDFRNKTGQLLEKTDVEIAASRLHAFLAQSLRSLPDDLERKCGLDPVQVQYAQDYIDKLTSEIRARLNEF